MSLTEICYHIVLPPASLKSLESPNLFWLLEEDSTIESLLQSRHIHEPLPHFKDRELERYYQNQCILFELFFPFLVEYPN
jgi:hypothetical protein